MEFTISLLLIPYAILVVLFFVFAFFNLYHMIAYGFVSVSSFIATFLFFAVTAVILYWSYVIAMTIPWDTAIAITNKLTY